MLLEVARGEDGRQRAPGAQSYRDPVPAPSLSLRGSGCLASELEVTRAPALVVSSSSEWSRSNFSLDVKELLTPSACQPPAWTGE